MVATTLFSQTRAGELVREFPAGTIETYGWRINAPGACRFLLPAEKLPDHAGARTVQISDVLEDGLHEVGVRRGSNVVWLGPLLTVDETHETTPAPIAFGAEGLLAYARRWHVTAKLPSTDSNGQYNDVDQATIFKSLVDHHQAKGGGDFGIDTTAIAATGVLRTRTEYDPWRGVNILEAMTALAGVESGFDFDIEPSTRALRIHYPQQGRRRMNVTFNEHNIVSFRRSRDASQQASAVVGFGDGFNATSPIRAFSDSGAIAKHGLTERLLTLSNVTDLDVLDAHIRAELAKLSVVANVLAVTIRPTSAVPYGSFGIGDEVRVRWPSPYRPVDDFRRVIGIDVRPHPDELLVVYLEEG
jgi:hypothetical protein